MSKRSCEAAESIEDASLRMARVNGRQMQNAPRGSHCVGKEGYRFRDPTQRARMAQMTGALRKILQKCLRLGLALKTPLCYNIHSGQ